MLNIIAFYTKILYAIVNTGPTTRYPNPKYRSPKDPSPKYPKSQKVTSHRAEHSLRRNFANCSKRQKVANNIFERTNEIQAFKARRKISKPTNKKRELLNPTAKNPTYYMIGLLFITPNLKFFSITLKIEHRYR